MVVDVGELKISVEKPAAWARRLTITVPADRIERERRSAVDRLAKRVRLPGFRKGKVPAHLMEKRYGAAIEQETLEKVVGDAYREALQKEGLQPITQGSVDNVDYESGNDLTFRVDLEIRPEVELNRIGGFRLQRRIPVVEESHVDRVLERLQHEQAAWRQIEGEAPVVGDMVVVDITALRDDAEPTKPRRYQIVLGEGQAAPAIEESIRTLRPGEAQEFTVDLRRNAEDESSPAEPHRIHVALLEAQRPDRPAADDEFARSLGDFEGLDDLRSKIRQDLEREADQDAERTLRVDLVQSIIEANPFDVPRSMVDDYLARVLPAREGIDESRLAEVRETARPGAERALQRMLVVERVAEMEVLGASPDEVEDRIGAISERLGRSPAETRAQLQKSNRLHEIEEEITENKVFDYLKSLSTIG
ncbi:MAG: trigger factor [Longimicrobiales bacterium]